MTPVTSHPRGLYVLFFTEMWERFSYYGMRALLVLYMVRHFNYADERAYVTYGSYTALVWATPVFGGILADRLLGYRKAVTLGGILMALGHFAMAFDAGFYPALGLIIVGNGFFKPNISTVVGRLYAPGDSRCDAGFTLFYMGINLGAVLSPAVCGAIGETYGWHYGFGMAGIGMLCGLGVFLWGQRWLGNIAEPPMPARLYERTCLWVSRETLVILGSVVASAVAWQLVQHGAWVGRLLGVVGVVVLVVLMLFGLRMTDKIQRSRLLVAVILTLFSVVFWAFFEQAGSSLNLFAERNVDRRLPAALGLFLGQHGPMTVPTSLFQAVNPLYILLLAPLFGMLWVGLGRRGKEPSIPLKFALGILQLGLGFGALWLGTTRAGPDGMVNVSWLMLGYLLQTSGELCLSPIGLSMITKLSPAKIAGLMMGTWFLSSAFAQYAGGLIAALTGVRGDAGEVGNALRPAQTVHIYGHVFGGIALCAIAVGLLLLVVSPALARRTHGAA